MNRVMTQALEDEEADQEFWGQDFFREEEREADWEKSGSEATDVPDSDFDKSVRADLPPLRHVFTGATFMTPKFGSVDLRKCYWIFECCVMNVTTPEMIFIPRTVDDEKRTCFYHL